MELSRLTKSLGTLHVNTSHFAEAVDGLVGALNTNQITIDPEKHRLVSKVHGHNRAMEIEGLAAERSIKESELLPRKPSAVSQKLLGQALRANRFEMRKNGSHRIYSLPNTDVEVTLADNDKAAKAHLFSGLGALVRAAARDPELVRQLHLAT